VSVLPASSDDKERRSVEWGTWSQVDDWEATTRDSAAEGWVVIGNGTTEDRLINWWWCLQVRSRINLTACSISRHASCGDRMPAAGAPYNSIKNRDWLVAIFYAIVWLTRFFMLLYGAPAAGILSPQLACRQLPSNYSELKGDRIRHCQRSLSGCVGSMLACGPIGSNPFWNLLFSTFFLSSTLNRV